MRTSLDTPRVLWQLTRLIRASQPHIVQSWMYHADLLGGLASRLAGNQHVVWGVRTTDVSSGCSRVTIVLRRLCAFLSHWVPHTIVCAAEASRKVHVSIGYDSTRMKVVPNGFDMSRLVSTEKQRLNLRAQLGYQDKDLVVGSLGRFNLDKDQENFVKAADILIQRHPLVRFLMVGRDLDSCNSVLAHWIRETGHADRFTLLGERPDVATILSAMDVFCLHSRTEGFPNVLGEAMAIGLACVTTDVGDARLMLGDAGVVVPKKDAVALARGVEALLVLSEYERILMGQKARKRINDEFTMSHTRERFETIYNKILTGNVS
jgi:glycosyltransferase involved in cell wall biosynthesis